MQPLSCLFPVLLFGVGTLDVIRGFELGEEETKRFGIPESSVSLDLIQLYSDLANEVTGLKSDLTKAITGLDDMRQRQSEMKVTIDNLELQVETLSAYMNDSRQIPGSSRADLAENQSPVENIFRNHDRACDLDILFVLDGSGSVGKKNFAIVKGWVKTLSKEIKLEMQNVRFGVMQYSHKFRRYNLQNQPYIKTHIKIGEFASVEEFSAQVDNIKLQGYTTHTGAALRKAKMDFEKSENFNKTTALQIMILVTDGLSSDWRTVAKSAKDLRNSGVIPFAIGIGGAYLPELKTIANGNENDTSRVFLMNDFNQLGDVTGDLKRNITSLAFACGEEVNETLSDISTATSKSIMNVGIGELQDSSSSFETTSKECDSVGGFIHRGDCFWLVYDADGSMAFQDATRRCNRHKNAKLADIYSMDLFFETVTFLEMKATKEKWDWVMVWTAMVGNAETREISLSDGKKIPYASALQIKPPQRGGSSASHVSMLVWADENPPVKENGLQLILDEVHLNGALCQL